MTASEQQPEIRVGLFEDRPEARLWLHGAFSTPNGENFLPGSYTVSRKLDALVLQGPSPWRGPRLRLNPIAGEAFSVETTIGVDFHWQQDQVQRFSGSCELYPGRRAGISLINHIGLESYLRSVIGSEMSASSPPALLRAHAVISRSWLLAQIKQVIPASHTPQHDGGVDGDAVIRWYDREAHQDFDVCADDHCQRYQGLDRISNQAVVEAIDATRGQVLVHAEQVCDARFAKCCGGVTDQFSSAWGDVELPYLTAFSDANDTALPSPGLDDEQAFQRFVDDPPAAYCNCQDAAILDQVLPGFDRATHDFFRWTKRLDVDQASALVEQKMALGLGRLRALEPIARGPSGRLTRLRLVGEKRSVVIGKELEIRRALDPSHLYSSAFYVVTEGKDMSPETFVLHGAGWGHGVGLCQIGAAVMASQGHKYQDILSHYYPDTQLQQWYK